MPKEGFTKITLSDELKAQLKHTAKTRGLTMPDLIRSMLATFEKYDKMLKTDNKIIYDLSHKLEAIQELLRNAPVAPEHVPDEIMKILATRTPEEAKEQ